MSDTAWTLQDLGPRTGYPNWRARAIRDRKTNVHLATVGNVDRYFEGDEQKKQAFLMLAAPELKAALHGALFFVPLGTLARERAEEAIRLAEEGPEVAK